MVSTEDVNFNLKETNNSLAVVEMNSTLPSKQHITLDRRTPSVSKPQSIKFSYNFLPKNRKRKRNIANKFYFQSSKNTLYLYYIMLALFTIIDLWAILAIGLALNTTIYHHNEVNVIITLETSPFSSKKYFWGNYTRNKYGDWYGYLIFSHVICGVSLFSSLNMPLFLTMFGSYYHMFAGSICVVLLFTQLAIGLIPTTFMFYERGFTPCPYSNYSFPVLLYVHFVYWLLWMSESVCYAISAVIYRRKRFPKLVKYLLVCMSVGSIMAAIFRILYICSLIFIYGGIWNIKCILGIDIIINGSLYAVELLTTVFSVKNIRYGLKRRGTYSSSQWRMCHNRNIILVAFLVFWTMMANIAYKTVPSLAVVAYIAGSVLLLVGMLYYGRRKAREKRGAVLQSSFYSKLVRMTVNPFIGMFDDGNEDVQDNGGLGGF